jgi:hypothetical protein
MQKYRVLIHGQNLLTEIESIRKRVGFYTDVFVEAFASSDAEARALDVIREDAQLRGIALNAADDSLRLLVEEVHEIESFDGVRLPRTGLALYEENDG